jgi:hypothetical protein
VLALVVLLGRLSVRQLGWLSVRQLGRLSEVVLA